MPIFSKSEIEGRLQRFAQHLQAHNIDKALVHSSDNVYYLTGVPFFSAWGRPMWAIVSADGRSWIVGPTIELISMEEHAQCSTVLAYDDSEESFAGALKIAKDLMSQAKTVGGEISIMPHRLWAALTSDLGLDQIVDVAETLGQARLLKGPEEIALLRLGGQIARIGMDAALSAVSTGITEMEVAGQAVLAMNRAFGALGGEADITSSYAYCQFGTSSMQPHTFPTQRRLRRREVVCLAVSPVVSGYCMASDRTLVWGEPTPEQERALRTMTAAFELGKSLYRPGVRTGRIDVECTEFLAAAGYRENLLHATGLAHGIMVGPAAREEMGELRRYNDTVLQEGMVSAIEPGIYLPGIGGFRHADVMVITGGRSECLTDFPTSLNR